MDGAGVIRIDAAGRIAAMDDEAQAFWKGDLTGELVGRLFAGAKDGSIPRESGASARCRDDSTRPVAFEIHPVGGGWELRAYDAEAERREAARIVRSEAQLREAQEVGRIGSWVWDIANDEINWSDELYRMYGLEPQEFPATFEAYMERIHPDDQELAQSVVQKAFQDMGPFSFDHRLLRPDGEVRWLHGQGAVDSEGGKPVRMYGIAQDITVQRNAEEAEKRALERDLELEHYKDLDESRKMLINSMAHELHTPLTPMRLQLSLLASGRTGELTDPQRTSLDILERNATRLEALVSDLLDVARMDSGTLHLSKEPTDVTDVLTQTRDTFAAQAEAEGITLDLEATDTLAIEADRGRLTQVLYNLVSNAIKFSDSGDKVHIMTTRDADGIRIEVQDEGIGLTEEQIGALFQPFVRVHEDPDRPGNGLGLHISRGLVEAHGGVLEAASDGPGKGSTFTVRLPGEPVVLAKPTT